MTEEDYARKLGEVDRVLNDPCVPIQPALIWRLLAEISEHDSEADTNALGWWPRSLHPVTTAPAGRYGCCHRHR